MKTVRFALAALTVFALTTAAMAGAHKFHVNDPAGRNVVTFTSEAPLEDIVGTTNQITGWIEFDPMNPDNGGKGMLSVPVASLDTGIPLRDEHLRSAAWLNAEGNPEIQLNVVSLKNAEKVKSGEGYHTFDVTVEADFSLNGKTMRMMVPGRVTYLEESEKTKALMPGNLLAVRAEFPVTLADFGVTGPDGMDIIGSKVGETVTVEVSFRGTTAEG